MMTISQKCQYAVRAIFELTRRYGDGPTSASEIASVQAIPPRFLELIISQVGRAGFVTSRRGAQGGYQLAVPPGDLKVGDVIRIVEGPIEPVDCAACGGERQCPLEGRCVFVWFWRRAAAAMSGVYDTTTFADLLDEDRRLNSEYVPSYSI